MSGIKEQVKSGELCPKKALQEVKKDPVVSPWIVKWLENKIKQL